MFQWLIVLYGIAAGIYASYTDIKENIIENRLILSLILVGAIGHLYFIFNGTESLTFSLLVFGEYFGLAFVFYWLELIPSGDAKLYASLGFLIPPNFYRSLNVLFPISTFTINCFLPLGIGLMFVAIKNSSIKKTKKSLKRFFNPKILGWILFRIFSLSGFVGFVLNLMRLRNPFLLSGFLIVGLMALIRRISISGKILYLPFFAFTVLMSFGNITNYLYSFLLGFLIYGTLRILVMDIANNSFIYEVNLENLKPGMIIADDIRKNNNKDEYEKKFLRMFSAFSPLFNLGNSDSIINMKNEGLRKEDIERLKELKEKGKIDFDTVKIHQTLPFAPFILLGFTISIIIKQNLLSFVYGLII